jgi:hypothetical protein
MGTKNSNVAPIRPIRQPAGVWLVDAETPRAFELEPGDGSAIIPPGETVGVLMDGTSTNLGCGIAILKQMANDLCELNDVSRAEALDGVVKLLQQAKGMNTAAYETLLETAITLGQK